MPTSLGGIPAMNQVLVRQYHKYSNRIQQVAEHKLQNRIHMSFLGSNQFHTGSRI